MEPEASRAAEGGWALGGVWQGSRLVPRVLSKGCLYHTCDRRFWSSSNLPELTFCPRVEKHKQKWLSWPLDSAWFLLCA